jgi:hypothetical protein
LRDEIRKLRARVSGDERSIQLVDGSVYKYRADEAPVAIFRHGCACADADYRREARPEPPEVLKALSRARDRSSALTNFYPDWRTSVPMGLAGYDLFALVKSGRLEPRPFAPGFEPRPAPTEVVT